MTASRLTLAIALSALALAHEEAAAGSPPPWNPQFQVNTYTTGAQFDPDVAVGSDGSTFVVWNSTEGNGTDRDLGIRARWGRPDGTPAGSEFQVNQFTPRRQHEPSVAPLTEARFIVVWLGDRVSDEARVHGAVFAAPGSPAGSEFLVREGGPSTIELLSPDVGGFPDGGFVVVWHEVEWNDYSYLSRISARRYDPVGAPVGAEYDVAIGPDLPNDPANLRVSDPLVAAARHRNGEFVVVGLTCLSSHLYCDQHAAWSRGIGDDGGPLSPRQTISTWTLWHTVSERPDAGFAVAWSEHRGLEGKPTLIRQLDASGEPAGAMVEIASQVDDLLVSDSAVRSDGTLMVVGAIDRDPYVGTRNVAGVTTRLAAPGSGDVLQLATHTAGVQLDPRVAATTDGQFLVVWQSSTSPGSDPDLSIQGRFVAGPGTIPIRTDGFETGDFSGWNEVVAPSRL